jgi:hypothetical protein
MADHRGRLNVPGSELLRALSVKELCLLFLWALLGLLYKFLNWYFKVVDGLLGQLLEGFFLRFLVLAEENTNDDLLSEKAPEEFNGIPMFCGEQEGSVTNISPKVGTFRRCASSSKFYAVRKKGRRP